MVTPLLLPVDRPLINLSSTLKNLWAGCIRPGQVIPNNSHFDTTRANIEYVGGGKALNLLCPEGLSPQDQSPFKGNMDVAALTACIAEQGAENIPFCMLTVTTNTGGGQPVSLQNVREFKAVLRPHRIPLVIDACRFAAHIPPRDIRASSTPFTWRAGFDPWNWSACLLTASSGNPTFYVILPAISFPARRIAVLPGKWPIPKGHSINFVASIFKIISKIVSL